MEKTILRDAPGVGGEWARAVRRGEPVRVVATSGETRHWRPSQTAAARLRRRLLWPLAYLLHP